GMKIFGQTTFNYAAHIRGVQYNKVRELCDLIEHGPRFEPSPNQSFDTEDEANEYIDQVSEALSEIR
ncbi:hypothetical protein EYZ11_010392, partial [Aspergillus tanneri]